MFYVYILRGRETGRLYRGLTENLKVRLKQHNTGKVKATKSGIPWHLVYYEAFLNETDARREELFLKSGRGKERLKLLLQNTLNRNSPRSGGVA